LENTILSGRSARGYDVTVDLVDKFEDVKQAAGRLGIRDARLKKDVLCVGPCPGLWKAYYAATIRSESVRKEERLAISKYLGISLRSGITRKRLGEEFESWVKDANQTYNDFLGTEQTGRLEKLPGVVGVYYAGMARQHSIESSPVERNKTFLDTDGIKVPDAILLYALNPDGVFVKGARGAIFESKLSVPNYHEFSNEIATYAIALEHASKKNVDIAIVLHSDYPDGKRVTTKIYSIQDSAVSDVSHNIEKFLRLVQITEVRRKDLPTTAFQKIKGKFGLSFGSWKDFLLRPEGLPDADKRTYCHECRFRETCYTEGGQPSGP
jgi:hypothetical protein